MNSRDDKGRAGRDDVESWETTVPPQYRAAWYQPARVDPMQGDPEFGEEEPEALRAAGATAVAHALAGLADYGRLAWRKDVREVSALILAWIDEDGGEYDDLLTDIGFRPKRGASFSQVRKLAMRNELLREVIDLRGPSIRTPTQVARDIREEFESYEINGGWQADKSRKSRPQGEPRAQFWAILNLGLHYPLPSIQSMAAMVEQARR